LLVALPRPYAAREHATPEEVALILRLEDNGYVGVEAYCAWAGVGVRSAVQAERAVTVVGDARVEAARVVPPSTLVCPGCDPRAP
jgi:hypothetical protein